ncbi:MAG: AAA family ATPase [Acidobacteria bacterium]|nr:AAA family ATPase [Acidobacteriota bacterium]
MAFADTGWIELRKINLLLGRNSSGKSAVIRALRLLKQSLLNQRIQVVLTARESDKTLKQPLTFVHDGCVDLGSFSKMLHRRPFVPSNNEGNEALKTETETDELYFDAEERKRYSEPMTFSFRGPLSLADWPAQARTALFALIGQGEGEVVVELLFHVRASYRQDKHVGDQIYLWQLEFGVCESLTADAFTLLWGYEIINVGWNGVDEVYTYGNPQAEIAVGFGDIFGDEKQVASYIHFLSEIVGLEKLFGGEIKTEDEAKQAGQNPPQPACVIASFWHPCQQAIAAWLESIVHIGPIRPLPRRSYALSEDERRTWQLAGWQPFLDYLDPEQPNDERDRKVNRWLRTLKLGHTLKRDDMLKDKYKKKEITAVKLWLDETGNGDERDLTDIGFGASQILPVIIQCLSAAPDALVLIEQPELHLHPEAQADVADLFVESINDTVVPRLTYHPRILGEEAKAAQEDEKRVPVTRRYLIETHSETIFLRLRVELTRKGNGKETKFPLNQSDFVCYYIERSPSEGASGIEPLLFDSRGEFTKRTERFFDFFGQDFKETIELRKARS